MSLPSDAYGRTVTAQVDVNGQDVYTVTDSAGDSNSMSFPTGTPASIVYDAINAMAPPASVISLSQAQQEVLVNFSNAVLDYTTSIYDEQTQFRLLVLYVLAQQQGLSNRLAYLAPAMAWVESVVAYSTQFEASVMSQTSVTAVLALQWDFGGITLPSVTLQSAIEISN